MVLIACGGTEPPDPATSADIRADGADGPVTVSTNVAVHLSWTSENATSCQVSPGGWNGTTGAATVDDLRATTTYRLSCNGAGGEAEDTVHILVTPPGTQIVFQSSDSTDSDIYVVNADGSGLTRLTDHPDADLAPTWSGDGRQIYFLSYNRDGRKTLDLYAMNANGTDEHLVVDSLYLGFYPWWPPINRAYAVSPDGTRIALGPNVFVMNVDGSDRKQIVELPCDEYYTPCEHLAALDWSPDGRRIAYAGCWGGHGSESCNIRVVNADGTGQRVLASTGSSHTEPAWAPDGQRIAFSSYGTRTSLFDPLYLEIINADGTGRTVLLGFTEGGAAKTSPSWSPDGQSIVFAYFQPNWNAPLPEESDLFAVNLDGTNLRHVTTVPGGAFAPDWNPAGP